MGRSLVQSLVWSLSFPRSFDHNNHSFLFERGNPNTYIQRWKPNAAFILGATQFDVLYLVLCFLLFCYLGTMQPVIGIFGHYTTLHNFRWFGRYPIHHYILWVLCNPFLIYPLGYYASQSFYWVCNPVVFLILCNRLFGYFTSWDFSMKPCILFCHGRILKLILYILVQPPLISLTVIMG